VLREGKCRQERKKREENKKKRYEEGRNKYLGRMGEEEGRIENKMMEKLWDEE